MHVTLIGIGCGTSATLTEEARRALTVAQYAVGAKRLLEQLPCTFVGQRAFATKPQEILALLLASGCERCCVVYSGDSGFYSGARSLVPLLQQQNIATSVVPGISSLQYFAAALGEPWQEWALFSAHGAACDAVAAVCAGKPAFFLTGGTLGPAALCGQLAQAGLGDLPVQVGENLSYATQQLHKGTAGAFAKREFAPLSVLLAGPAPRRAPRTPGIPDEQFARSEAPMTKQEVRAAALAKLAVTPEDICWDIGAGTGSVAVELALQAKAVWAVEQTPEACALVRKNRTRFCAWNLHLVEGKAPAALQGLPVPNAVFVGGSGGELSAVLKAVQAAAPSARVCVSAIALETLHTAAHTLAQLGYQTEITQIAVSRAKAAGELHLLLAQNPVFLITGRITGAEPC